MLDKFYHHTETHEHKGRVQKHGFLKAEKY